LPKRANTGQTEDQEKGREGVFHNPLVRFLKPQPAIGRQFWMRAPHPSQCRPIVQ
jgi:hypothetical protein